MSAFKSLVLWNSIMLPSFLIYYLNRTERMTKDILWSFILLIPFVGVFMLAQLGGLTDAARNPVPAVSTFFLFYFSYFIQKSSNKIPKPGTFLMLAVLLGFNTASTLLFTPYVMPYIYGPEAIKF
jgi:hypothetical protein